MATATEPARPKATVASAARLQRTDPDPGAKRVNAPWQERAFYYYDVLGEVWYAAQFYARALSLLELNISDVSDIDDPTIVTDSSITEYLDRIQDPGGGRSQLQAQYGRLQFVAAECYLLRSLDDDDVEQWEMLSTDELKWDKGQNTYKRFRAPSAQPEIIPSLDSEEWEPIGDEAMAWRMWRRHPRYSNLADGPMHGVLDLCEELLLLTKAVRARARSRAAGSGILLIPSEILLVSPDGSQVPEDKKASVFMEMLTEAMVTPIGDEGSASAVVPLILTVAAEYIDKFKHLQILNPMEVYPETGLRMECIQRIALGLDMPPEILLGVTDANHWSAWQVDEQSWKTHLQPVAQALCDDLTSAYLRPSMRKDGVADPERYAITYDAASVINHPDTSQNAKDDHDRLVISDRALRESTGFDEDDAPDEEELTRRIGIKLGDATLATTGEVAKPAPSPFPAPVPNEGDVPGETPGDVTPGAPEEPDEDEAVAASAALLRTVAAVLVERSRELAGSRLRSACRNDREAVELLNGVHNREVAPVLQAAGRWNGFDAAELVTGAIECYAPLLGQWGLDGRAYAALEQSIAAHAAATLCESEPDRVPPSLR